MKKVRSSADMSKRLLKTGSHNVKADPNKRRYQKRDVQMLGKAVKDGDDIMIKFIDEEE